MKHYSRGLKWSKAIRIAYMSLFIPYNVKPDALGLVKNHVGRLMKPTCMCICAGIIVIVAKKIQALFNLISPNKGKALKTWWLAIIFSRQVINFITKKTALSLAYRVNFVPSVPLSVHMVTFAFTGSARVHFHPF